MCTRARRTLCHHRRHHLHLIQQAILQPSMVILITMWLLILRLHYCINSIAILPFHLPTGLAHIFADYPWALHSHRRSRIKAHCSAKTRILAAAECKQKKKYYIYMSKQFPPETSTSRSAHFAQHPHLVLTSKNPALPLFLRPIVQQIVACVELTGIRGDVAGFQNQIQVLRCGLNRKGDRQNEG